MSSFRIRDDMSARHSELLEKYRGRHQGEVETGGSKWSIWEEEVESSFPFPFSQSSTLSPELLSVIFLSSLQVMFFLEIYMYVYTTFNFLF